MKVLSTEGLTKLITLCKNAFLTREDAEDVYTVDVEGDVTEADTVEVEEVDMPEIVSSVDSSSTNNEAVGAKLFYDTCGDIETLINAL